MIVNVEYLIPTISTNAKHYKQINVDDNLWIKIFNNENLIYGTVEELLIEELNNNDAIFITKITDAR